MRAIYLKPFLLTIITMYSISICAQKIYLETNFIIAPAFNDEVICLVSVDTNSWKNKIIWSKTSDVGTESFNVYKETGLDEFSFVGNVPFNQPSELIDYSSQPESHGDKYKISVMDTCGNESDYSPYHKTMNLTVAVNGTTMGLNWDDYEDESGDFIPSKFYIFKGNGNNLELYDSISSTFHSYNDYNVYDSYYYMVAVRKDGGCNTNKTDANNFSFSNKKQNFEDGINKLNSYNSIKIYPNPFSDKTTIEFDNSSNQFEYVVLTDITGKLIRQYTEIDAGKVVIERDGLNNGIYYLEIKGIETLRVKIVVH